MEIQYTNPSSSKENRTRAKHRENANSLLFEAFSNEHAKLVTNDVGYGNMLMQYLPNNLQSRLVHNQQRSARSVSDKHLARLYNFVHYKLTSVQDTVREVVDELFYVISPLPDIQIHPEVLHTILSQIRQLVTVHDSNNTKTLSNTITNVVVRDYLHEAFVDLNFKSKVVITPKKLSSVVDMICKIKKPASSSTSKTSKTSKSSKASAKTIDGTRCEQLISIVARHFTLPLLLIFGSVENSFTKSIEGQFKSYMLVLQDESMWGAKDALAKQFGEEMLRDIATHTFHNVTFPPDFEARRRAPPTEDGAIIGEEGDIEGDMYPSYSPSPSPRTRSSRKAKSLPNTRSTKKTSSSRKVRSA